MLFKKSSAYSTPNRIIIVFDGLLKEVIHKPQEVKGPNVNAPEKAIEGFLRSFSSSSNFLREVFLASIVFLLVVGAIYTYTQLEND